MSSLAKLSCSLPSGLVPDYADAENVAAGFTSKFTSLDMPILAEDVVWRDLFALTGSARTFYGAEACFNLWGKLTRKSVAGHFKYQPGSGRTVKVGTDSSWVEGVYTFQADTTPKRDCVAILSLTYIKGEWKIWVIRTVLDQLHGHPNVDHKELGPNAAELNPPMKGQRGNELRLDCAIIGAGQAGLSVAGRLAALGVSYVVLEKNKAIGDNWSLRYKSTKLHTTRESSHLPFDRTFPDSYREFLTKYDLSKGYKDWVNKYGINVWLDSTLQSGQWQGEEGLWRLKVRKEGQDLEITAAHVVMAVGAGCQIPVMPKYPGSELFRGKILHSGEYHSPEAWKGKKGIVVGTANTGHDVAEDMLTAGLSSVTMIQRSPTYVLPAEYYKIVLDKLYNASVETKVADTLSYTNPLGVNRLISKGILNEMAKSDPDRFDRLEQAGFKLIRYGDIIYQLCERFGGHYMDVGASTKIANGLIKVKSDASIVQYYEKGVIFDDGSRIESNLIVYATGFVGNMRQSVKDFFGEDVASRVEDFWGVDHEGEIKGAFRPSGHPHLWLHGGTCGQARYFSRFIALQIRAELDGTPLL